MSQNCLSLYCDLPTDKSHDKYDLIIVVNFIMGLFVCRKFLFSELNDNLGIKKIDARLSNWYHVIHKSFIFKNM